MYEKQVTTSKQLLDLIETNEPIPASVIYAVAAILEKAVFINGSP